MSQPPRALDAECQRLDKWLWAARLFKTRALATAAISGGKVHVDGERVKPSRCIRPGTEVRVRKSNFEITLHVVGLSKQRGPAPRARLLYTETEASAARREQFNAERKAAELSRGPRGARPTKRDRRRIGELKRNESH